MAIILDGTNGVTTPSVNSSSNLISTVVSSPTSLSLKTNGSNTAVTIDTSQNVGVGTSTGLSKLTVLGPMQIQNDSNASGRLILRAKPGNSYRWNFDNDGGTNNLRIFRENDSDASAGIVVASFGTGGMFALQGASITSGIGVAFPATQAASSDANTLDDYEEGTWTPIDNSGAGLSLTINGATYIKIGQLVVAWTQINYPSTASGNGASIAGLPFTVAGQDIYGGFTRYSTFGYAYPTLAQSGTYGSLYNTTGGQITNASLSSKRVDFTYVYRSNA